MSFNIIFYTGCILMNQTQLVRGDYEEGIKFCKSFNARLVEIHTPEQMQYLNIMIGKTLFDT